MTSTLASPRHSASLVACMMAYPDHLSIVDRASSQGIHAFGRCPVAR